MVLKQLQFAARNLFRNRLRSLINFLIIGICTIVIILISGFYDYLFQDIKDSLISSEGHIYIKAKESFIKDFEKIDKMLSADDRIFIAFPRLWVNGLAGFGDKSAIFAGEAVFFDRENTVNRKYGNKIRTDLQTIDIGTKLAENLGVKEHDTVNLLINFNGLSFEVANVVSTASQELDRHYLKLPLDLLFEELDNHDVESIHVILKNERDLPVVQNSISSWLTQNGYDYHVENYNNSNSYFRSVINIYLNNFYFVLVAILLTNFFAISNSLSMAIMERVKELGIMRSFGTKKSYIVVMFVNEGFLLGLFGFITGLLASLFIIFITRIAGGIYIPPPPTTETGFYAQINISLPSVMIAFLSATLVSIISSFIATFRVIHMNIMDKIRYI